MARWNSTDPASKWDSFKANSERQQPWCLSRGVPCCSWSRRDFNHDSIAVSPLGCRCAVLVWSLERPQGVFGEARALQEKLWVVNSEKKRRSLELVKVYEKTGNEQTKAETTAGCAAFLESQLAKVGDWRESRGHPEHILPWIHRKSLLTREERESETENQKEWYVFVYLCMCGPAWMQAGIQRGQMV